MNIKVAAFTVGEKSSNISLGNHDNINDVLARENVDSCYSMISGLLHTFLRSLGPVVNILAIFSKKKREQKDTASKVSVVRYLISINP